jgi:hypothetical protein
MRLNLFLFLGVYNALEFRQCHSMLIIHTYDQVPAIKLLAGNLHLRGGATAAETARPPLPSQSPSVKPRRMFAYPWETLGDNACVLDYYKVSHNRFSILLQPACDIDFSQILGVEENTTIEEIKSSYKSLVLSSHPDRNPSEDAAEKFVAIREAWEILSDPEARNSYDTYLADRRCASFLRVYLLR